MSAPRYMILRKWAVCWVPATNWRELQDWPDLRKAATQGWNRDQALRVIEWNRPRAMPGTSYRLMPIDDFLKDELQFGDENAEE